jgi:uncharacterized protein
VRRPPPDDVWLDERLVVERSPIEGHGLFFSAPIAADTVVIELGGKLASTAELEALIAEADADPRAPFVDTITVDQDQHLVLPTNTPIHFGNHSCDPTIWHVGPYSLATRRAVMAGEEATIDYGTQSGAPGFQMSCRCGAITCRGVVTSDDWRNKQLQARYEGHWVPALQARIDSR